MSWVRFSSDDYRSDVYVWDDVFGGVRTEVASLRPDITDEQLAALPPVPEDMGDPGFGHAFVARHVALGHLLDTVDSIHVPEPEGGRSYHHATWADAADNLERLAGLGINVPRWAIDDLREAAAEDPGGPDEDR